MKLTCLILEERSGDSGMLPTYLSSLSDQTEVVAITQGVAAAETAIRLHRPDLVFMHGKLARRRPDLEGSPTILLTNKWWTLDELSASGAGCQLLTPVSLDELLGMMERVTQHRKAQRKSESGELHVMHNLPEKEQRAKVSIPVVKGFNIVRLSEIVMATSAGCYADVHLTNGVKFQASRSLKYLASELEPLGFVRCHDSFLVNTCEVIAYTKGRGGTVAMSSGAEVPVSRYRKELLMEVLMTSPSSSRVSIPTEN